jgi:hypothetical protein
MAVPTVVQTPNAVVVSGAASAQLTMGAVTGGNSLIAGVYMTNSGVRSFTVSDSVNAGNWTSAVHSTLGDTVQIHYRHNVSSGTPEVTWVIDSSTWIGLVWAVEVSGLDTTATPTTDAFLEAGNSDNHQCADPAMTGTDVFVLCLSVLSSTTSGITAGSGYTRVPNNSATDAIMQYKAVASLNDTGPYTSVGTDRTGHGCMAAFPAPTITSSPTDGKIIFRAA